MTAVETASASATTAPPVPVSPVPKDSKLRSTLHTIVPPIAVFGLVIGLWYIYSTAIGEVERKISLPYFHDVIQESFFNSDNRSELFEATIVSARVALVGLGIAIVLGVAIAIVMSQASWIERSLYPYAVLMQTVPILALVPLIGLRFGFGFSARVIVVVIIALFPIITNTLFGLKSSSAAYHDLFTLHSAGRPTRLRKLMFPSSIPAMFTGFQISAGLAVVGAIVGGFFFGRGPKGLGNRIQLYTGRSRVEELIGAIIMSALLGVLVFWFFGWAKDRLTRSWLDSAGPS